MTFQPTTSGRPRRNWKTDPGSDPRRGGLFRLTDGGFLRSRLCFPFRRPGERATDLPLEGRRSYFVQVRKTKDTAAAPYERAAAAAAAAAGGYDCLSERLGCLPTSLKQPGGRQAGRQLGQKGSQVERAFIFNLLDGHLSEQSDSLSFSLGAGGEFRLLARWLLSRWLLSLTQSAQSAGFLSFLNCCRKCSIVSLRSSSRQAASTKAASLHSGIDYCEAHGIETSYCHTGGAGRFNRGKFPRSEPERRS